MNPSTDSLRVVYVAANAQQAHLLAGALEDEGIAACVSNETLQGLFGSIPAGFPTDPRVLVDEKNAFRARQIALEFDHQLRPAKAESAAGRAWHQFTIRAILFVTLCVAIYLGVDRALAGTGVPHNNGAAVAAVYLVVSVAFFWALFRKLRERRTEDD
jgi:hypothetical protein